MITCQLLDGKFQERCFADFREISETVERNRRKLHDLPLEVIIALLAKLGRSVIQDPAINSLDGVSYISLWLRKGNLEKICRLNYQGPTYCEDFTKTEHSFELCALPRGIVCHWIANNVPTLAFFSVVQAVLSRNGSLVKAPEANISTIARILRHLAETGVEVAGKSYSGKDIVNSIALVSFDGKDNNLSTRFSMAADCKIVWGGSDAVRAVTALPQKDHCETIPFGPKYSFGVFDREFIESDRFEGALAAAVKDIAIFNQAACSSPQVYFFEASKYGIDEIAKKLRYFFEKLPEKLKRQPVSQGMASRIINARGHYLLDESKNIVKSDDLSWTILIDEDVKLEEPVHGKTIYIKEVGNIDRVVELVTRKVQAMSVCILDECKKRAFASKVAYKGVDRIVPPGRMHDFDLPWDGILTLSRLVRWVLLKN